MPLISPNLSQVKVSTVYHPKQENIRLHIQLTAKTIEKLVLQQFQFQLSPASIELMERLMIEMSDLYLFDAEQTKRGKANKSDDGPSELTCLTILVVSILIFHQLVDKKSAINDLIDTTPSDEDNFDIDELESEIESIENLSDASESSESSEEIAPQASENGVFAAFTFALMTAFKVYYDEEETHVVDVFDTFASMYKSNVIKMNEILGSEQGLTRFKKEFNPLNGQDLNLLTSMGQRLTHGLKETYEQLIHQIKILTSFVSYNSRRKYVFSLFQIEINALNELYADLRFDFSMSSMYEFLERTQEFVLDSKKSFESFQRFLREFGKLKGHHESLPKAASAPSLDKIEHMFALFKISNSMPLRSISNTSILLEANNIPIVKRRNSF